MKPVVILIGALIGLMQAWCFVNEMMWLAALLEWVFDEVMTEA